MLLPHLTGPHRGLLSPSVFFDCIRQSLQVSAEALGLKGIWALNPLKGA